MCKFFREMANFGLFGKILPIFGRPLFSVFGKKLTFFWQKNRFLRIFYKKNIFLGTAKSMEEDEQISEILHPLSTYVPESSPFSKFL
jgi:hypothetical protein